MSRTLLLYVFAVIWAAFYFAAGYALNVLVLDWGATGFVLAIAAAMIGFFSTLRYMEI